MHANIDKGAEGRHVGDHAFQQHAGAQIFHVFDAFGKTRRLELRARIAAGFLQFFHDVPHRRQSETLVGERLQFQAAQAGGVANQLFDGSAAGLDDFLDHRIGLGVYGRSIERFVAARNAQKAGALLEGFFAEARHLE